MTRLPALVLPLVLLANPAGAQTLKHLRSRSPAPGDSMPHLVTREFELYGPTEEDVRLGNSELRVAITQFGRYLGEQPKKMAFVLFRSAADIGRYDFKPFTSRGVQPVAWVLPTRPGRSPDTPGRAGGGANSDPLGHEAGHRFLIAYVKHAPARPGGAGGSAGTGAPAGGGAADAARSNEVAAAHADPHPDIPALPDWLEEAVAALCEQPSFQKSRLDFMRARLDRSIPFAELFSMRRPAAGEPPGVKRGAADPERAALFCAEALSLARYIEAHEDDRFVGKIVEGVLRGRTAGDVLNTSQNIFSKAEVLEREWRKWMENPTQTP